MIITVMLAAIILVHIMMFLSDTIIDCIFDMSFLLTEASMNPIPYYSVWDALSHIYIIALMCLITAIVASKLLGWKNQEYWSFAFIISIVLYILLGGTEISNGSIAAKQYNEMYYHGAFKDLILFTIAQIAFIASYNSPKLLMR